MAGDFLAIDWDLRHARVREEDFFDGASFASADALFVDPCSINDSWIHSVGAEKDGIRRTYTSSDRGFGDTISRLMAKRRGEVSDLLYKASGMVVCRLLPRGESLEVITEGAPGERVDRYAWLPTVSLVDRHHQLTFPANSRFLPRSGEDVVVEDADDPFEEYLAEFSENIRYQAVYDDLLSTPISRFAKVLARNKVGDIIALAIPFDEGRLVLLPPLSGVSPRREAEVLVRTIEASEVHPGFLSSPDWLPGYSVPGEDSLRDELAGLSDRQEKLKAKYHEVSSLLEKKAVFSRILYSKGRFTFLPAIVGSLSALGFSVEKLGDELTLSCEEGDALCIAVSSEDSMIGVAPYRRLADSVALSRTSSEGPSKGILIINASRELDPKRRPTQFTAELLRGCKGEGFCLLTTYELYKMVQQALGGKADLAALRRSILDCDGEFRGV